MTSVVRGTLRNPDGSPVPDAVVKAFDVSLRAETLLGQSPTNADGSYEVGYARETLRPDGKNAADLVVRAYADGRSEIARSNLLCRAPSEAVVDLVVGNRPLRGPLEYDSIIVAIRPYLGDIAIADLEREDVHFLACSAGVDRQLIATLIVASRLARATSLPDRLFYALGRQGIRLQLEAMMLLRRTTLNDAFNAAIAENIVFMEAGENGNDLLDRLQTALVREAFNSQRTRTTLTPGAVLATSLVSRELQEAFLTKYVARSSSVEEFWKSLEEDRRFSKVAIQDLRLTLLLGKLARYRVSVLEQLKRVRESGELKSLRDLVRVSRARWREILRAAARDDGLEPPADIPGETADDRLEHYITSLRAPVATLFPNDSLRTALAEAPDTESNLARFIANTQDLDLYWTDIDTYLHGHRDEALSGIPATDHGAVIARAKRIQRLLRVSPRADTVRVLDAAGFDSALAIARTPKSRFQTRFVEAVEELNGTLVDAYAVTLPPTEGETGPRTTLMMMSSAATPAVVADHVHARAVAVSASNLQLFVNLYTAIQSWPEAIGGPGDLQRKLKKDAWKEIPDLENLFGSQSFCECEHCRSIYGPAAYLVDLLHFLDDLTKKPDGTLKFARPIDAPAPIQVLLRRRSDIAHIPLTCENTNTLLPYIDLVNEALESFVASHLSAAGDWTDVVLASMPIQPHDTGAATASELRAVPQHIEPEVYAHLARKAVYPMTLPFHRPLAAARAYLAQLGVRRQEIMEVFRTPGTPAAPPVPSDLAIVIERLGMSPAQYQIVAANTSSDPIFNEADGLKDLWVYYGYGSTAALSELKNVPMLLHRLGVSFDELVALLKTRFLNPKLYSQAEVTPDTKVVAIAFPSSVADDACDVSRMTVTNVDPVGDDIFALGWLGRAHRFVRLTRVLGWSIEDVDRAVAAVGGGLTDSTLEKLAALKELASTLERPAAALLVLFADLDTWGVEIEKDPVTAKPKVTHRAESIYAQVFLNRAVVSDEAMRKVFEDALLNSPTGTLDTHAAGVAAALAITADDLERIRQEAGLAQNAPLGLATLSVFSRYGALAQALGIRVRDLITLLRLVPTAVSPFQQGDPTPALEFVRIAKAVEGSGFPIALLNYLFRDEPEPTRHPAPTRGLVKTTLTNLQKGLAGIHQELLAAEQSVSETLRARLELAGPMLNLEVPAGVERALAVIDPRRKSFQEQELTLGYRHQFANAHFASFLPNAGSALFGTPQSLPTDPTEGEKRFLENAKTVLDALLPWLRRQLQRTFVGATLADAMGVEQPVMRQLVDKHLVSTDPQQPGTALDHFLTLVDTDGQPIGLHLDAEPPMPPTMMVFRIFKAAAFINGFNMTNAELGLFAGPSSPLHPTTGSGAVIVLNLNDLPIGGAPAPASSQKLFEIWRALRGFQELRETLPRSERSLVDYFSASGTDAKLTVLEEATGWETKLVKPVLLVAFGGPDPPGTAPELIRLQRAMSLLKRIGATPAQMFAWAATTSDHEQADAIIQTVKARYDSRTWLDVARSLNDPLREKQRDALAAFLIPRIKGAPFPIKTTNDLFEYFLIDVEMSSCMLTSRIKQAISSVQLFVQRCLLNLEPDVNPNEIDPERWNWMKHYRVAEANRKVFVHSENYIFPELRDDKTPFFKELETELLQGELTDEKIEKAVTNYLYKLDDVARLDIRGFCTQEDGEDEIYHVVGRTWNPPHAYYYRRGTFTHDSGGTWTPWERIELDVQAEHVLMFVHERRLFLLWPLFDEKSDQKQEGPQPMSHWSIRMAWTERGSSGRTAWESRRVSTALTKEVKAGLKIPVIGLVTNIRFVVRTEADSIAIDVFGLSGKKTSTRFDLIGHGTFTISECKGEMLALGQPKDNELHVPTDSNHEGQALLTSGLRTSVDILLKSPSGLHLVPPSNTLNLRDDLYSFFIKHSGGVVSDARQNYFARHIVKTQSFLSHLAESDGSDAALAAAAMPAYASFEETWGPDPVVLLAEMPTVNV